MKLTTLLTAVPVTLAVLSYPLLVHFRIIENSTIPFAVILLLIISAVLINFRRTAVLLSLMLMIALILLYSGLADDLYFLPPIAINLFIGLIFLNGLQKHKTPLIEKYIEVMEGQVGALEKVYARNLTKLWALLLLMLMLESIITRLYFSHEIWSLFTNFINYLILGLMFVIEYIVRRKFFPAKQHMSFIDFIIRLKQIKLKSLVM